MIYEFFCKECNAIDEINRPAHEATLPYHCPECDMVMKRQYNVPNTITKGEQIPYFHPAFGKVLTDREAKAEARQNGWEEIGNENVAKHTPPPKRYEYEV